VIFLNKYEMLIETFNELLKNKDEILLRGYDICGLIKSLEKHEA